MTEPAPFDRKELQPCAVCKHGMAHNRQVEFYEVILTQVLLDYNSIRQIAGLEMMLGAAAPLASILGPTTQVGIRVPEPKRVLVCHECMFERPGETILIHLLGD